MSNIKDTISTVVAILLPLLEPLNFWLLSNEPFNWKVFAASCLGALIAYATGKNADMTTKTPAQIKKQEATK